MYAGFFERARLPGVPYRAGKDSPLRDIPQDLKARSSVALAARLAPQRAQSPQRAKTGLVGDPDCGRAGGPGGRGPLSSMIQNPSYISALYQGTALAGSPANLPLVCWGAEPRRKQVVKKLGFSP